jgi:hypothetical protein
MHIYVLSKSAIDKIGDGARKQRKKRLDIECHSRVQSSTLTLFQSTMYAMQQIPYFVSL